MKRLIAIKNLDSFEVTSILKKVFDLKTILSDGLTLSDNEKENMNKYQQFNNCSVDSFFAIIEDSKLANYITEQINSISSDKLSYQEIVDFILTDYVCTNACTEWLKDVMYDLHNSESEYTGFGNNINKIDNISELNKLNDNIGDKIDIPQKLDFNNRDKAFIFIAPDTLLISDKGESHTQMLNKYLDTKSDDEKTRKTDKELSDSNIEQTSFGHIIDNIAFIETLQGVSVETVMKSLNNFKKVYLYDDANKIVERLK